MPDQEHTESVGAWAHVKRALRVLQIGWIAGLVVDVPSVALAATQMEALRLKNTGGLALIAERLSSLGLGLRYAYLIVIFYGAWGLTRAPRHTRAAAPIWAAGALCATAVLISALAETFLPPGLAHALRLGGPVGT